MTPEISEALGLLCFIEHQLIHLVRGTCRSRQMRGTWGCPLCKHKDLTRNPLSRPQWTWDFLPDCLDDDLDVRSSKQLFMIDVPIRKEHHQAVWHALLLGYFLVKRFLRFLSEAINLVETVTSSLFFCTTVWRLCSGSTFFTIYPLLLCLGFAGWRCTLRIVASFCHAPSCIVRQA